MTGRSDRRPRRALCALALFAVLALPAAARADYRTPSSLVEVMRLHGSHGFRIELTLIDHRQLLIEAHRGSRRGGEQTVSYFTTTGRSPGTDIDTPIGRLGRVHVRFLAASRDRRPGAAGCVGGATTVERGVFVGWIGFRGERDYTRVRARRASGEVTLEGAQVCHFEVEGRDARRRDLLRRAGVERSVQLLAGNRSRSVGFEAARTEGTGGGGSGGASFLAYAQSRSAGLKVTSLASVYPRSDSAFELPDPSRPSTAATVRPPAPFSGRASFRLESPSSAGWTGDLTVDMPNLGKVRLTGPDFYSGICVGRNCSGTLPDGVVADDRPERSGNV